MANILKIAVENPEELLSTGVFGAGALIRIERSATGGGSGFSEAGTVALVSGTYSYTYSDNAGSAGAYYRHRYSKATPSVGADYSPYSDEYQGGVDTGLCTIYDAKQRLGILPTDVSEDENLADYIRQATAYIHGYTGRWFLPVSGTYTFDGDGGDTLWVPRGIRSITTLEIAAGTGEAYTATTSYVIRPTAINRDEGWPGTKVILTDTSGLVFYEGFDTVRIVGTFGWAAVPDDINEVALDIVNSIHRVRGASGGDVVTVNIDGSRTIERALSWRAKTTLDHYRVWRI